jgi:hypothetical protein
MDGRPPPPPLSSFPSLLLLRRCRSQPYHRQSRPRLDRRRTRARLGRRAGRARPKATAPTATLPQSSPAGLAVGASPAPVTTLAAGELGVAPAAGKLGSAAGIPAWPPAPTPANVLPLGAAPSPTVGVLGAVAGHLGWHPSEERRGCGPSSLMCCCCRGPFLPGLECHGRSRCLPRASACRGRVFFPIHYCHWPTRCGRVFFPIHDCRWPRLGHHRCPRRRLVRGTSRPQWGCPPPPPSSSRHPPRRCWARCEQGSPLLSASGNCYLASSVIRGIWRDLSTAPPCSTHRRQSSHPPPTGWACPPRMRCSRPSSGARRRLVMPAVSTDHPLPLCSRAHAPLFQRVTLLRLRRRGCRRDRLCWCCFLRRPCSVVFCQTLVPFSLWHPSSFWCPYPLHCRLFSGHVRWHHFPVPYATVLVSTRSASA